MNDIKTTPKHISIVTFSLIALVVVLLSTLFSNILDHGKYGLASATVMLAVSVLLHILAKNRTILYFFSFVINSVAFGRVISANYLALGQKPSVADLLIFSLPAAAILIFVSIMLALDIKTKKITVILAMLVNVSMLVWFLAMWITSADAGFGYGFFASVLSLGYACVFAVGVGRDDRLVLRDISYGSFGIIVAVIVLATSIFKKR